MMVRAPRNLAVPLLLLGSLGGLGASCGEDGDVIVGGGGEGGGSGPRCDGLPPTCEGRSIAQKVAAIEALETHIDDSATELATQCKAVSVALGGPADEVAPSGDLIADASAWCTAAAGRLSSAAVNVQITSPLCVFPVEDRAACEASCAAVATCSSDLTERCEPGTQAAEGCTSRPLAPPEPCTTCMPCIQACAQQYNFKVACQPAAVEVELPGADPATVDALRGAFARLIASFAEQEVAAGELEALFDIYPTSGDGNLGRCVFDAVGLVEEGIVRIEALHVAGAPIRSALTQ